MVAQSLGLLYKVPRRLLCTGQHQVERKCCYEGINSAWKLIFIFDHKVTKASGIKTDTSDINTGFHDELLS